MKKSLGIVTVAILMLLVGIYPAAAQGSREAALVRIPFRFIIGGKALPAGTYEVWSESSDWEMMAISTVDKPTTAIVWVRTKPAPNPEPERRDVHLQFKNYYGQYFLQWVQLPLSDIHEVKLSSRDAEKTLTRLNLMPVEGERGEDNK